MLYGSMRRTPKLTHLPNLAAYFIAGQYPFVPAYAINNSYNVVPRGLPPRRPQRRRTCSASHRVTRAISLADPQLSEEMRERSEEHTSELQSLMRISYAVFCLKKQTSYQYSLYKTTSNTHKTAIT